MKKDKKSWRDFTLGEISDEIDNDFERLNKQGHPREFYVRAKQALEQMKSLYMAYL